MFFAQSIEHSRPKDGKYDRMVQLYIWYVELNPSGRLIWQLYGRGHWVKTNSSVSVAVGMVREKCWDGVPNMQEVAVGKLVTMRQAEKLTGVRAPAALDYLADRVLLGVETKENYVKPKPVKAPKPEPEADPEPTPADIARAKQRKAEAKVAEWERRTAHAVKMAREWRRRMNYQRRRAEQLSV